MVCPVSFHLNGECEHHRVQRAGCRGRLNPHSADTCQQWVGVTALAVSVVQRSAPAGCSSVHCSSVDAIWAATAAADRNRISPCPNPGQTGSHIFCLRDWDGIGTQMYGSGTVAGPTLAGAGRAWESCLRERAGVGWYNLSHATL